MKKNTQNGKFRLFAGIPAGAALLPLALAFTLVFSACPSPTGGGGDGGGLNKTELQTAITDAEAAKSGVMEDIASENVPLGKQWVTDAEMTDFDNAITAAKNVRDTARNQAAINSAKTMLNHAIQTFNSAKQPGTATPVDISALSAQIAGAENARANVPVNANAGNVAFGTQWVTQTDWDTFDAAITSAKNARDAAAGQSTVNQAVTTLNTAINTFNTAKQNGSKMTGFSAEDFDALIAQANAAKSGVKTSNADGDDVGPEESWVNQNDLAEFNTAITSAQAAGDFDNRCLTLSSALTAFNGAKKTGTAPDKTALFNAILEADAAKQGVAQAASKAEAPMDSPWAMPAQFAPLNTAYAAALSAASNSNETKNEVDAKTSALSSATSTFTSVVNGNGPGEKANSITITGLTGSDFPNGTYISVALNTTAEFSEYMADGTMPQVSGDAQVIGGQVLVPLFNSSTTVPWTGNGSWYVGLILENGRGWVSKAAIDFTANANPTKALSDFKPYAYSYKLGEFAEGSFDLTPAMTLDDLLGAVMNVTYAQMLEDLGQDYKLYKNEAMTQEFSGANTVNANTTVYCAYPFGGMSRGEKIGEISGTITFTNVPVQKPKVYIHAWDVDGYLQSSRNEISLSGISGSGGTVTWTIPLYERDEFTGTIEAFLGLRVSFGASGHYDLSIDQSKQLSGLNASAGSLGTVSLASVTLSGTINVSYQGNPVPYVDIYAYPTEYGGNVYIQLRKPAPNAPWSIVLPAFTSPTDVDLDVVGRSSNNSSPLFEKLPAQTVSVYTSNRTGITINLGNITPPAAVPLTANTWVNGDITPANSTGYDLYSINVTAGQTYCLWWNDRDRGDGSKTLDVTVSAQYSGGANVDLSNEDSAWGNPSTFTAASSGTVIVKVKPWNSTGTYAIAYSTSSNRPGGGAGSFPPSSFTTLTSGTWANGSIETSDSQEWFRFTATSSTHYIHVTFRTLEDLYVELYDSTGNPVGTLINLYDSTNSTSINATSGQTYYIKVWPYYGGGNYQIAFNTDSAAPGFPQPAAVPLTANTWVDGEITSANIIGYDLYSINVSAGQTYYLWWNDGYEGNGSKTLDVIVSAQYSDEANVDLNDNDSAWENPSTFIAASSGTVIVKVEPWNSGDTGTYAIAYSTANIRPDGGGGSFPPSSSILLSNVNTWANGNIATAGGQEWFRFTATSSTHSIHVTFGTLEDLYVALYDSTGNPVGTPINLYGNTKSTSINATSGQTYYIKVWPVDSSNSGNYQIAYFPPPAVVPLTANTWVDGEITSDSAGYNLYSINVTAGQTYYLWWNDNYQGDGSKTLDVQVSAQYSGGANINLNDNDSAWENPSTFTAVSNGTVIVKVEPYESGDTGTYAIAYSTANIRPDGGGGSFQPSSFTALTFSTWASGNIATAGGQEWFRFTAASSTQYIHTAFGTLHDLYVELYDSTGNPVGTPINLYNSKKSTSINVTSGQTYYIKVWPFDSSESGNYQIAFNTNSAAPGSGGYPLTANTWADGDITSANIARYDLYPINVTAGQTYYLWWNDGDEGNGSKTLDVKVSAHYSDGANVDLSYEDSAWEDPSTFTAASSGTVIVKVEPYESGDTGTYAIAYSTSSTRP